MIELIPFEAHHAFQLINGNITPNFVKVMQRYEKDGDALTVLYNGELFCCGGVKIEGGNGTLWSVNGPLISRHPFTFHRTILRWLNLFMNMYELNRLQAYVLANNKKYIKWIEKLGFHKEGLMKMFYDGQDYLLYAKLKGGGE